MMMIVTVGQRLMKRLWSVPKKACSISTFHPSWLCITKIPKTWYCPNCLKFPEFNPKNTKVSKNDNKKQNFSQAMNLDHICTCSSKAKANDKLIKCHNVNCSHGTFFHLSCMGYKKYPNNARTNWTCPGCKVGVCNARKSTTANDTSDTNIDLKLLDDEGTKAFDDSEVNITNVSFW